MEEVKEDVSCYKQNMLDFLRDFEPLKNKYHVLPGWESYPPAVAAQGARHDETFQFSTLAKKNFSGILGNLSLVYGNREVVQNDIEAFFKTEKEIIIRYLNLPLVSSMFDEDYFEFEWDMHVGQNFAEHRSDYYRDHFIHQVRNMYMMHELLDKWFYPAARDALSDKTAGRIPQYVYVKFQQFINDKYSPEYILCQKNANSIREFMDSDAPITAITDLRKRYLPYKQDQKVLDEDYAFHYFYKYVIYASSYLSALFHDMGYPICHFLGIRSRISEYNPALYMITQNITGSIDDIFAKLGDSLLFTIVSHEEIKSRMKKKSNGQYDHGLYSALIFLLHFYETDAIQALSPEKRCAVELAALAIYNHTLTYACAEKPEKALGLNYYQPVFRQNPVSFLLHFCDDLEEWDRRYFEISDASALSVCSDCHGMLMPHAPSNRADKDPWMIRSDKYKEQWGNLTSAIDVFDCFCSSEPGQHKCFRRQTFLKRQIYLVTTASKVSFRRDEAKKTLHAKVHYDLFRLLQMSHINNTYAKFRLKDLRELKCRTYNQHYKSQCKDFPFDQIFVDAFMSSNPILIKVKLLEEAENYVKQKAIDDGSSLVSVEWKEIFGKSDSQKYAVSLPIKPSLYDYIFTPNVEKEGASQPLCRMDFYKELLEMSTTARDQKGQDDWKQIDQNSQYTQFIKRWLSTPDEFYNRVLGELVYDCVYQYRNEPTSAEDPIDYYMQAKNETTYKSIYEPEKAHSDALYDAVLKYCHDKNSFNQYYNGKDNPYIGYFGDLFFFERLNDLLDCP